MLPRVTDVRHIGDYEPESSVSEGAVASLDFRGRIEERGGAFKPLADTEVFAQVSVDREVGTLVWPCDVDLCPDVLYAAATGTIIKDS